MENLIPTGLKYNKAHRGSKNPTEMMQMIVDNFVRATGGEVIGLPISRFPNPNSATAGATEFIARNPPSLRSPAKVQTVTAEILQSAVFNRTIGRKFGAERTAHR